MGLTRLAQDPWSESHTVPTFTPPPVEVKSGHVPLTAERATEVVRSHLERNSLPQVSTDGQGDATADDTAGGEATCKRNSPLAGRPPGLGLDGLGIYDTGAPTLSPSNQPQQQPDGDDGINGDGEGTEAGASIRSRSLIDQEFVKAWMREAEAAQSEFTFGGAGGADGGNAGAPLQPRPPSGPPPLHRRLSCPETLLQPEDGGSAAAGQQQQAIDALEPLANHHMWMYNRDRCPDGCEGSALLYSASSALEGRPGHMMDQKWQPRYAAAIFETDPKNSPAGRFSRIAHLAAQGANPDAIRSLAAVIIQSYLRGWRARRQAAREQAAQADEQAKRAAAEALARERAEVRRRLRQSARDCLLAVHAQQDYDRTRARLAAARGLGPGAAAAAPPPPPTIPPALWCRCKALGLDPIQVLLDSGMRSQQIEEIINASQLAAQLPRRAAAAAAAAHLIGSEVDGGTAVESGDAGALELVQRAKSCQVLSQAGRGGGGAPPSPPLQPQQQQPQLRVGSAVGGRQPSLLQPMITPCQLQQQPQQQPAAQLNTSAGQLVDQMLLMQQLSAGAAASTTAAPASARRGQPLAAGITAQRLHPTPQRSASGSLTASPPRLPVPQGPGSPGLSLQAGMQPPPGALRGMPPCAPRGRSRRMSVDYVTGGSYSSGGALAPSLSPPVFASMGGSPLAAVGNAAPSVFGQAEFRTPMRSRSRVNSDSGAEPQPLQPLQQQQQLQAVLPQARSVVLPIVRQTSSGLDRSGGGVLGTAISAPAPPSPMQMLTGVQPQTPRTSGTQLAGSEGSPGLNRRSSFIGAPAGPGLGLPPTAPVSAGGAPTDAAAAGSGGGASRPMSPLAMGRSSGGGGRSTTPTISPRSYTTASNLATQGQGSASGLPPLLPTQGSWSVSQQGGGGGTGSGTSSTAASPVLTPFASPMGPGSSGGAAASYDVSLGRMRRASNLGPPAAVGSPPTASSPISARRLQSAAPGSSLAAGATGIAVFSSSPSCSPARIQPSGPSGSNGSGGTAAEAAATAALPGGYVRALPPGPTRSQGQLLLSRSGV